MTDPSTPLTALCNICHSAPPKYTCPRDSVRTCSLPCAQTHKRRAACNGQRDPSAYVSKASLSTPTGIDRDYNFLSSVERNISSADKETRERGVSLSGVGKAGFEKRWHDGGPLARYLRGNGVVVHKAPVGMRRQRDNQTRFIAKSKRIVWSVEWVVEGEKRIMEVDESRSVELAYGELLAEKERESRKRKRALEDAGGKAQKQKVLPEKPDEATEATYDQKVETSALAAKKAEANDPASTTTTTTSQIASPTPQDQTINASETPQQPSPPSSDNPPPSSTTHKFYLHKPHTSTKSTVLIPLSATATITINLKNQHVLEFPTIYVFDSPAPTTSTTAAAATTTTSSSSSDSPNPLESSTKETCLPDGFMTLQEYMKEKTDEEEELKGLLSAIPEGDRKEVMGIEGKGKERETVDEKQVLEVLQRDVEALKK